LSVSYLDRFVDLVGERIGPAIRIGQLPDSSLRAHGIGSHPRRLVASPGLAEEPSAIAEPSELAGVPAVICSGHARPGTRTLESEGRSETIDVEPRLASNSGRALAIAAPEGLGVAYLPAFHTCEAERQGRLVRLLPEWGGEVPVRVVYPTNRHVPLQVRALMDFLLTEMASSDR
jgi:DNA-binding transcriptional LysR family regulator